MRQVLPIVAAAAVLAAAAPASAADASFGCKVLLCAAASAPGWPSIPYCVPVMETVFRRMAHGHPWPTCPEGHAGSLGHEPFLPCPAGETTVTVATDGTIRRDARGGRCAKSSALAVSCRLSGDRCDRPVSTRPRERRAEPDFVDITTANGTQRLYFDLGRYR